MVKSTKSNVKSEEKNKFIKKIVKIQQEYRKNKGFVSYGFATQMAEVACYFAPRDVTRCSKTSTLDLNNFVKITFTEKRS